MSPAQRLARLPGCWRPGVLWSATTEECPLCHGHGGFRWREADGSENGERCPCSCRIADGHRSDMDMCGAIPDITDPATVGCLAAWAREVYGDPNLHAAPTGARWQIRTGGWRHRPAVAEGPTEGDAWAAAILAKLEQP